MKKIIFIILQIIVCSSIFAQAPPEAINYQAVARNLSGVPLVNQSITVQFDILQGSSSGSVVYSETHAETTNQFGLFTSEIGLGSVNSGNFSTINWGSAVFYLQVTVDGDVMPATQLLSVPYALHAKTATSGVPGADGHNSLMSSTLEPAGLNCANGGYFIQSWLDLNDDGALSAGETPISYYICNGVAGTNGTNGLPGTNGADGISIDSTINNNDGTFSIYYSNGTSFTSSDLTGPAGANGTTYFAGSGINLTNDTIVNIGDADADPNNEIQTLSINAAQDSIFISNGNGVQLPSVLPDTDWTQGIGVVYNNTDYIGIGTPNPLFSLDVVSSDTVVAAFRGNNPDFTAVSLSNTNPTSDVGFILLTGPDTAIFGLNPTNKMLILDNSIAGGHIALNADSTIVSYAEVVGNIANTRIYNKTNTIYNESDSIFNYSTTGTNVNVNQGMFLTDSLYVLGNNADSTNWILANDGFGQAKWTDPSTIVSSVGDDWGSQAVIHDTTLTGTGIIGTPLSVNPTIIPTQTSQLTNNSGFITTEIDGDTLNELQTISASGGTSPQIDLSNGGGNVKILGTGGTTVNQSGNAITINSTSGTTYTAGTAISVLGDSITNLAPDQVVVLQSAGATTVSGTYPSFTISSTDSVNDADANPTNELITSFGLNATNDTIVLKEGPNTFTIPKTSLSDGNGIYSGSGTISSATTVTQGTNPLTFSSSGNTVTSSFMNSGIFGTKVNIDHFGTQGAGIYFRGSVGSTAVDYGNINGGTTGLQLGGGSGFTHLTISPAGNVGINGAATGGGKFVVNHTATTAEPTMHLRETGGGLNRIKLSNNTIANKYWEIGAQTNAADVLAGWSVNYFDGSTYRSHIISYGNGNLAIGRGILAANKSLMDVFGTTTLHDTLTIDNGTGSPYSFPVSDGASNYIMQTNGAGLVSWVDPSSLANVGSWTESGGLLYPTTLTNNVGIGTTTPSAKLHIVDSVSFRPEVLLETFAGNFKIGYRYKTALAEWSMGQGEATGQQFRISDIQTGTTPFVIEQGSGNVGIGTISPESMLHVALPNTANHKAFQLGHGNQPTLEWLFKVDEFSLFSIANENNGIEFTAMVIDANNGNVGIGTTTPSAKFEVENNTLMRSAHIKNLNPNNVNTLGLFVENNASGNGDKDGISVDVMNSGGTKNTGVTAYVSNGSQFNTAFSGIAYPGNSTVQTNFLEGRIIGGAGGTAQTYGVSISNQSSSSGAAYGGYFANSNDVAANVFGVRADVNGSPSANTRFGIYSSAVGGIANYGGYFNAAGGTTNWAGYFASGDVFIQDNLVLPNGAGTGLILTSNATGVASWQAPSVIWSQSGSEIHYNSGNVGIGMQNPNHLFHIQDSTASAGTTLFRIENNIGTPIFEANNDGNVGIGTSSPFRKLEVATGGLRVSDAGAYLDLYRSAGNYVLEIDNGAFEIAANGGGVKFNIDDGDATFDVNLHVNAQFQLNDGSQGAGKVLTSIDAAGNAKWEGPIVFKGVFSPFGATTITATAQIVGGTAGYSGGVTYNTSPGGFGGSMTIGNMKFRAAETGYYQINGSVHVAIATLNTVTIQAYNLTTATIIAQSQINNPDAGNQHFYTLNISTIGLLNASDDVVIRVVGSSANSGSIVSTSNNKFEVNLIR